MSGRLDSRAIPGRVADVALAAALVVAPVAGGSTHVIMVPILATMATVAALGTLESHRRQGRAVHVPPLVVALLVLAAVTALQGAALPRGVVSTLSPRLVELVDFVAVTPPDALALSYAPSATAREVAKLLLYAVVGWVAHERVRAHDDLKWVSSVVAVAGLATAIVGLVNRLLGLERIMGVLPTMQSADELLTTFPNPNHSAGFLTLSCLAALGVALEVERRSWRAGFGAIAALSGSLTVASMSRGGVGALLGALLAMGVGVAWLRRRRGARVGWAVGAFAAVPLAALAYNGEALLGELFGRDGALLGLDEKLAALRDAAPMISEHPWVGIGRGAYLVAYPRYKTSELQLLFASPENVAVQLVAEWGIVLGGLALIALVGVVVSRVARSRSPAALGAYLGVFAVLAQNLVDFSLEVPGVALSIVALLAAHRDGRSLRLELGDPARLGRVALAAVACLVAPVHAWRAFAGPDLRRDLRALDARVADPESLAPTLGEAEALMRDHPASYEVAARLGFLAMTREPRALDAAERWTSRAVYLAPTYADGYLQLGRLLMLTRHREQGLDALRRGLGLVALDRRAMVADFVLAIVHDGEELRRAVPRRNEGLDLLDERFVADVVQRAVKQQRRAWLEPLFRGAVVANVPASSLRAWSQAALAAGQPALAREGALRWARVEPELDDAVLLAARAELAEDDADEAARTLDAALAARPRPSRALVRARTELAIKANDPAAEAFLDRLSALSSAARADVMDLARLRATWAQRTGRLVEAVHVLDKVIGLLPHDLPTRLHRAALLRKIGRRVDARRDLEFVLARDPGNTTAQRLLEVLAVEAPEGAAELRALGRAAPSPSDRPSAERPEDALLGLERREQDL
jgi:tetratricopeptide (TPR) repeat protein